MLGFISEELMIFEDFRGERIFFSVFPQTIKTVKKILTWSSGGGGAYAKGGVNM